jgi:2-octaprenyl-6-methoxyphenol hydroxylase
LALNAMSLNILSKMGFSQLFAKACPIEQVHISVQGHIAQAKMHARAHGLKQLGAVIEQHVIEQACYEQLLDAKIDIAQGASIRNMSRSASWQITYEGAQLHHVQADICIATDGQYSKARELLGIRYKEVDYQQNAMVGLLKLTGSHQNIAFEHFTENGAFALLPMRNSQATFVWTSPSTHDVIDDFSQGELIETLCRQFKRLRLFKPEVLFHTTIMLKSVIADMQYERQALLLGNAAHSLHPIAAQGFNLSLRDLRVLSELLTQKLSFDELSREYACQRKRDQDSIQHYTHCLASMVGTDKLPAWLKSMGLNVLDSLPLLKGQLSQFNLGFV